jgi:iron complex outermembrane receptor protein
MTNQFLSTANKSGFLSPAAAAAQPTDQSFYRRYYSVNGYERQDTFATTARLEWTLPFATLTSISAYRSNNFRRLQDQDGTSADALTFTTKELDQTFSQELRLSNDGERLHWIGGLYYYNGKTDRHDRLHPGPGYAFQAFVNQDGVYRNQIDTKSYAAFGQVTYDFTKKFSVTLGGRYTEDKKESTQHTDPLGPAGIFDVHLTPDWSSFDPSLTLQYQADPELMFYASARRGFKSGGFQSLASAPALAATVYDPEHVLSYEAGMKSRWLDDRLQANVAIFRAEMKDQQILRIPTAVTSIIDNAGKTKTDGVDLSLSARIATRLSLDLAATYQKARFQEYTSAGVSFAGNSQLRSPDLATSFVAEYAQPLGGAGELRLRGEYFYQTKIFFDAANTNVPGAFQPDYGLVNARLTYAPTNGGWELAFYGKNLTDKEYFRNIAVTGPSSIGTPGDPRTYGAEVNWHLH